MKRLKKYICKPQGFRLGNPNEHYYPTDTSSTDTSASMPRTDEETIDPPVKITNPLPELDSNTNLACLLQERSKELRAVKERLVDTQRKNDILSFKLDKYSSGFRTIHGVIKSSSPNAPLPRYIFDKRLNF